MARRSVSWDKHLAKELRDPEFARLFLRIGIEEEDIPIQVILAKVIRAYGVKEFAKKAKLPSSNVIRALNPDHNPTLLTLNRLLRPFNLQLTVKPLRKKRAA